MLLRFEIPWSSTGSNILLEDRTVHQLAFNSYQPHLLNTQLTAMTFLFPIYDWCIKALNRLLNIATINNNYNPPPAVAINRIQLDWAINPIKTNNLQNLPRLTCLPLPGRSAHVLHNSNPRHSPHINQTSLLLPPQLFHDIQPAASRRRRCTARCPQVQNKQTNPNGASFTALGWCPPRGWSDQLVTLGGCSDSLYTNSHQHLTGGRIGWSNLEF